MLGLISLANDSKETELSLTTGLMEDNIKEHDDAIQALDKFEGVENETLFRILWLLPCFILILIIFLFVKYSPVSDPGLVMFITGMVTAALSLLAFHHLMELIPQTLLILWDRKIIAYKSSVVSNANKPETNSISDTSNSSQLEKQYAEYIDNLKSWMNHPGQWAMGLFFSLLVFTWYHNLDEGLFIELFIAFIIGLMAWRMAITSIKIWQLGKKFRLKPQVEHEDGCGGLEPLGNLCLWNALIVTIPGIFLGGWIIISQGGKYPFLPESYISLAEHYMPLFFKLLLVPLAFAVISFFLPLLSIHQAMMAWRAEKQRELDQLSYKINQLDSRLLNQVDEVDPQESEKMAKKLEIMEQTYQKNRHLSVWPINTQIIIKFITSQSVPLLGLTGLGQPILKIINSLLSLLS